MSQSETFIGLVNQLEDVAREVLQKFVPAHLHADYWGEMTDGLNTLRELANSNDPLEFWESLDVWCWCLQVTASENAPAGTHESVYEEMHEQLSKYRNREVQ